MTGLPVLDALDQRLLGSLLEKQVTVPATYPLSLNALRTACNQTSSREPVSDYDEQTLEQRARALKDRGLLRIVWSDSGRRTLKYHQTLSELLELADDERALLTVLLLRGPQAPGELRTRCERLHPFADRAEAEACLERMASRPDPLVQRLERRPGQQDHRWAHLLGEVPSDSPAPSPAAPIETSNDDAVRTAYDLVAPAYADALDDELRDLPFERWLLDRVAADHAGRPVLDAGCGPGHVSAYLDALGVDVHGIDLSPAMVETARSRHPEITFAVGDLRSIMKPPAHDGWGAVLAWYSLVHTAPAQIADAVAALARPLARGGLLVIAVHAWLPGAPATRHVEEWFDQPLDLTFTRQTPDTLVAAAEAAGLGEIEWFLRSPSPVRAETTHRLYLIARRPA